MNKSLPNIQQCSACGKTGHKTQNCRTERNVNVKKVDRDFTKKEMSNASKIMWKGLKLSKSGPSEWQ